MSEQEALPDIVARISDVREAAQRLGIEPTEASRRTLELIDMDALKRAYSGHELGYRIVRAVRDAARRLA